MDMERARGAVWDLVVSGNTRITGQDNEAEGAKSRNGRTSPVVLNEQRRFAASSEAMLRIMKNPRLPGIGPTTSGGSGQRPCCRAGTGSR